MRITQDLPQPLTDADLALLADQLVDVLEHREELEAEKKSVDDGYKKQITATEAEENDLRSAINKKSKLVAVECLETEVPGTNEVVVVRLDTGAEVSRRTLTPAETQTEMFADETEDEMRARVLAVLNLRDVLRTAGVNATSDVLWELTPEQSAEARAYAAARETDESAEQPAWLAELILSHSAVDTEPAAEAETAAEATEAGDGDASTVEPGETPSEAAPTSETSAEPATAGAAPPAAKRKRKAAANAAEVEAKAQTAQAAASNGRLDEVDVQEELDKAGISIGLDVIASWQPEQLIDAVNYARVVVARVSDTSIEEPKRPAFMSA